MKILSVLFLTFFVTACGQDVLIVQGEPGKDAPVPAQEETFEGYYVMPNGGYVDIYEDAQGLYTVRASRLVFANNDTSTGALPTTTFAAAAAANNRIYINSNMTYVPATHNVKQDSNNALLSGSFLTELIIFKNNGKLNIRVVINNANSVLFNHTVAEE